MSDDSPVINPDKFCYYPFTQVLLQPTGVVSPCCWNQGIVLGEVQKSKITEIWNGEAARRLRREFLSGNPVSCEQQMRHIKCHLWSRRDESHKMQVSEVMQGGPARLDLRLNGKCNLQCVMCEVWKQPNGVYDASDFWIEGPTTIFPFLKEIDVLGGEPFVQADTFRLIDAVAAINSSCTWAFATNGSYAFGPAIESRLDKISIRWLQVSLDSVVPETYARVRVNGKLTKTLATLERFLAYRHQRREAGRDFRMTVTMCVQKENWHEIDRFLDYALEHGAEPVLQFAYQPEEISLLGLPEFARVQVLNHFEHLAVRYGASLLNAVLMPIADSIRKMSGAEVRV